MLPFAFWGIFLTVVGAAGAGPSERVPFDYAVRDVAVGPAGVWIIGPANRVFARRAVRPEPRHGAFAEVQDRVNGQMITVPMAQVAVGVDVVFGLGAEDRALYVRMGISANKPLGTDWRKIGGSLKSIAADENSDLAILTKYNTIFVCKKTTAQFKQENCAEVPKPPKNVQVDTISIGQARPNVPLPSIYVISTNNHMARLFANSDARYFWKGFYGSKNGAVATFGGVYTWGDDQIVKFITPADGRMITVDDQAQDGRVQQVAASKNAVYILRYHTLYVQQR